MDHALRRCIARFIASIPSTMTIFQAGEGLQDADSEVHR
jgi:hypothetical protein